MSERERLVETLKRPGPEHVVDGAELCPQCDGLSPMLGYQDGKECIISCNLCHDRHMVPVEDADRWRREMRTKFGTGA